MLQLGLDSTTLARTRFGISPAFTAVESLSLLRRDAASKGRMPDLIRQVVQERRLVLLEALFSGEWDYVPDALTPQPRRPETDLADELHAIATTSPQRLRWEIRLLLKGTTGNLRAHPTPAVLRNAIEQGEQRLAERLAAEIEQYWHTLGAPMWSSLRTRMLYDIEARGKHIVEGGFGAMLATLHPSMHPWRENQLRLFSRLSGNVSASGGLHLVPMVFTRSRPLLVADLSPAPERRLPMIGYPAQADGTTDPLIPATPELLGATRARILADLQTPRTTTELSERHYLTAGTVSYHLKILHRAGLVARARNGYRVLYQQTENAAALLAGLKQGIA